MVLILRAFSGEGATVANVVSLEAIIEGVGGKRKGMCTVGVKVLSIYA